MKIKTILLVATAALISPAFSATIFGETTDNELNEGSTTNSFGTVGNSSGRVGFSGNNGRNMLYVFQLPTSTTLGTNPFATADLQLTARNNNAGSFTFNADVYGLGRQDSATLALGAGALSAQPYSEATGAGAGETLIMDNFATFATVPTTTNVTLNTDATGDANLVSFLNAMYDGGNGASKYVVFRVNSDTTAGSLDNRGFNFNTANQTTANAGLVPVITYTLAPIPEPSIALLSSLASLLLLRRRR